MRVSRACGAVLISITFLLAGCMISTAHLSDFARSSSGVNFGELEREEYGHFEYEFTLNDVSDDVFMQAVRKALDEEGFEVAFVSPEERTVLAERGMRANEWNSVVGVYSRREQDTLRVKIIYRITQDSTGGWTQHYAENVGIRIRSVLGEVE